MLKNQVKHLSLLVLPTDGPALQPSDAYALRDKVNTKLERLCKADVIEPVQFSDWAVPIIPVLQSNGSLGICGHYKQTVNQVAVPDKYALLKVDDLLASPVGGESFTKLDHSHAYQ